MVHLSPRQRDPRYDFVGLVPDCRVVKQGPGVCRQSVLREKIVGPEIRPVNARRYERKTGGNNDPDDSEHVEPARVRPSCGEISLYRCGLFYYRSLR